MKHLLKISMAAIFAAISTLTFANNENGNVNIVFQIDGIRTDMPYVTIFGNANGCDLSVKACKKIETEPGDDIPQKTFTICGTVKEPVVARLSFLSDKQFVKITDNGYIPSKCSDVWIVVVPGADYTVTGNLKGKDFCDMYPSNDAENQMFSKYSSHLMPILNKGVNAYLETIVMKDKLSGAEMDSLNAIAKECEDKEKAFRIEFLNENTSSIASLWLMEDMLIRNQIEVVDLEKIFKKVDAKKYGDNYFYKAVKARIEGYKNAVPGAKCPPVYGKNLLNSSG